MYYLLTLSSLLISNQYTFYVYKSFYFVRYCYHHQNRKLVLVLFNTFVNMVSTRKPTQKVSTISTRKVGALDCFMKDLPSYLWCSNFSQSSNHSPTERVKPCCQPWIYKDNSLLFQKKNYYFIQYYLTVELEPSVKNRLNHLLLELIMFCYHLLKLSRHKLVK